MSAAAVDYLEVRIGSTEHWTTDLEGTLGLTPRPTYSARTLCGLALAGTPSSPAWVAGQPCEACQALLPCDECQHPGTEHINAHAEAPEVAEFIFANATCWSENICKACNPALHNDALVLGLGTTDPATYTEPTGPSLAELVNRYPR
jgi:hypothetical protein